MHDHDRPTPGVMSRSRTKNHRFRSKIKRFLSKIRRLLHAVEVPLVLVTFVTGVYLAVGTVLLAAAVPHKRTWEPWTPWFVALLVCAVWVPLYALYQTIEARLQAGEARRQADAQLRTQTRSDLAVACQRIVSTIVDACPKVDVNDLAACVWAVRDDGGFDEVARFYLPIHRPAGPVPWRKGKGVAGWAWEVDEDLFADLGTLAKTLDKGDPAAFDALPAAKRFGLSAAEFAGTRKYTGVAAIRLFSTDGKSTLLGMLILDYVGDGDFACIKATAQSRRVTPLTGGLGDSLTAAGAKL